MILFDIVICKLYHCNVPIKNGDCNNICHNGSNKSSHSCNNDIVVNSSLSCSNFSLNKCYGKQIKHSKKIIPTLLILQHYVRYKC